MIVSGLSTAAVPALDWPEAEEIGTVIGMSMPKQTEIPKKCCFIY
jgi:hypothetical protein